MIDEAFLVRPAGRADIPGIAALFRLVYRQTSHPCANPDDLAVGFARGEKWLVCESGGTLTACTGLVPHPWNATYECGRSVTHPAHQQQRLGGLLWRDSIRWAAELGEHDLLFATPRSAATCRMCGSASPPLVLFGHEGGANVANGIREVHAVGLIRTTRLCRRARPLFGPGTGAFFEERIDRLHFRDVAASPPPDLLVGPEGDHCYETPRGAALRYSRTETSLGWSVLVTSVDCPTDEVDGLFASFLADRAEVRHMGCYLLWDKLDVMNLLGVLGFQATAYMPGWYLCDGVRHDCLQLSWLAPGETAVDNGMGEFLRPIREALFDLARPAAPAAVGVISAATV